MKYSIKIWLKAWALYVYDSLCRVNNRAQLKYICNLRPDSNTPLSQDQSKLVEYVGKYIQGTPFITSGKRIAYVVPKLEDVTLWQVLEARRAETAIELIQRWCGDYSPSNVYHMVQASKYIAEQLKVAESLEKALFPNPKGGGGEDDPIREAKNILGMVQVTAELFHCSFEDAKRMNYTDAVLAISKHAEELEKAKRQ